MDLRPKISDRCVLCGHSDVKVQIGDPASFDCAVCGQFEMDFELQVDRDMNGYDLHPFLSGATRKAYASGHRLLLTLDN